MLSHADGKKHRAKARAFHASKQPPKETEEHPTPNNEGKSENVEETHTPESKKRKLEAFEKNGELGNGEVIHDANVESEEPKKVKCKKEDGEKRIKWKKIITSVLKSVRILLYFCIPFLNSISLVLFKKLCLSFLYVIESGWQYEDEKTTNTSFEDT